MQDTYKEQLAEPIAAQPHLETGGQLSWISQQRELFGISSNELGTYRQRYDSPSSVAEQSYRRGTHFRRRMQLRQTQGHMSTGLLGTNLRPAAGSINRSKNSTLLYPGLPALAFGFDANEWLEEALSELSSCADQALEEDLEAPSNIGLCKAKNILKELASYVGGEPSVCGFWFI